MEWDEFTVFVLVRYNFLSSLYSLPVLLPFSGRYEPVSSSLYMRSMRHVNGGGWIVVLSAITCFLDHASGNVDEEWHLKGSLSWLTFLSWSTYCAWSPFSFSYPACRSSTEDDLPVLWTYGTRRCIVFVPRLPVTPSQRFYIDLSSTPASSTFTIVIWSILLPIVFHRWYPVLAKSTEFGLSS